MSTRLALGLVVGIATVATAAPTAAPGAAAPPARAAHAARGAASATMMVVGRARTLLAPRSVRLGAGSVKIGRKRCPVPAGTALAGLLAARIPIRVTNAAGCDPASMFVTRVGSDANRGLGGWEYKVGHVSPSFGAGDPGGRLRSGRQLLWFWCVSASACQRTLAVVPATGRTTAGSRLAVRVVGYDDNGHGRAITGATAHLGPSSAITGPGGSAQLTVPSSSGRYQLSAAKAGLVTSFPTEVVVT
jgi:hypothetical protein